MPTTVGIPIRRSQEDSMAQVRAQTYGTISATPDEAYRVLSDYASGRPKILTGNFSEYRVEEGGIGPGTVVAYHFKAGGRERDYRMKVSAPDPYTLREEDAGSSLVTTWAVSAAGNGSKVAVTTEWEGASGVGGFFERTFAPMGLKKVYGQMLARLEDVTDS
jgi:Polyketide cyclase / dehydrase and lipid transport